MTFAVYFPYKKGEHHKKLYFYPFKEDSVKKPKNYSHVIQ